MAKKIIYVIPGQPTPLKRARFNLEKRIVFDPQKTQKLVHQITLREQHNNKPPLSGPLELSATFYMKIPSSWSLKHQQEQLAKPHTYKPDLDNMVKYLLDISNCILFKDDAQVVSLIAQKIYDSNPRIEFTLKRLEENCG